MTTAQRRDGDDQESQRRARGRARPRSARERHPCAGRGQAGHEQALRLDREQVEGLAGRHHGQAGGQHGQGAEVVRRRARPRAPMEREARGRDHEDGHHQSRRRHVVAEEAVGTVDEGVEAEEVVLEQHPRGEGEAAEESGVEDPLAVVLGSERLDGEIEQGEEDELLRAVVGGQRVRREGRGEQRPHREGEDRPIQGASLQARASAREAHEEHEDGEGKPDALRREDGDRAGGRDGGHEAELQPVEAAQLRPRRSLPRAA